MSSLSRRTLLAGTAGTAALALAGRARAQARPAGDAAALLDRAMARAGGSAALGAVRVLSWTAQSILGMGDNRIAIGIEMLVEPFTRSRSRSWLVADPAQRRGLDIGPQGGTLLVGAQSQPMPPAMIAHERVQTALYGLMLVEPLRRATVSVGDAALAPRGGFTLVARHPAAAPTTLFFDAQATLMGAEYAAPSPVAGGPPLAMRARFADHRVTGGILWPWRIILAQDRQVVSDTALSSFRTLPRWPG